MNFRKCFFVFLAILAQIVAGSPLQANADRDYKKIVKKYHRHGEFYNLDNLHANIVWDVLYKSPEFKTAYLERYESIYGDTKGAEPDLGRGFEFIVVLFTYNKKWNDLENRNSSWRLVLSVDGNLLEPSEIKRLKPTPKDELFYPFLESWSRMYWVRFPASPSASELELKLVGTKGKSVLRWDVASE